VPGDFPLFHCSEASLTTVRGVKVLEIRMEMRDITNESTLLKSYKTVFIDNQSYESIKPYRDHQGKFPVFTERVFSNAGRSIDSLLDYKYREKLHGQLANLFGRAKQLLHDRRQEQGHHGHHPRKRLGQEKRIIG